MRRSTGVPDGWQTEGMAETRANGWNVLQSHRDRCELDKYSPFVRAKCVRHYSGSSRQTQSAIKGRSSNARLQPRAT